MEIGSSIEVFQDVSFTYPREDIQTLRTNLREKANPPWQMDSAWESVIKSRSDSEAEIIAFSREPIDEIASSYLCLWHDSSVEWRIPNVVPRDFGKRLTICQYNDIVNDFVELVLAPTLNVLKAEIVVSPRRLKLRDMMSAESLDALRAFLLEGFVSSSVLHPSDVQRLCRFIWSLHEHDDRFDVDLFRRWLEEANSWPEDYASSLTMRVDQGLTLLKSR